MLQEEMRLTKSSHAPTLKMPRHENAPYT